MNWNIKWNVSWRSLGQSVSYSYNYGFMRQNVDHHHHHHHHSLHLDWCHSNVFWERNLSSLANGFIRGQSQWPQHQGEIPRWSSKLPTWAQSSWPPHELSHQRLSTVTPPSTSWKQELATEYNLIVFDAPPESKSDWRKCKTMWIEQVVGSSCWFWHQSQRTPSIAAMHHILLPQLQFFFPWFLDS